MISNGSGVPRRLAIAACAAALTACTVHVLPERPQRDQAGPAAKSAVAALVGGHADSADHGDHAGIPPRPSEEPVMTELAIPGSSHTRARSVVAVNAPLGRVRDVVFGFERYPEFMPDYKACHVLATSPQGARDVRMDIEVLGGLLRLWARVEVSPMALVDGAETYEGHLLDGNIKVFQTRWELRELDHATTRLTVDSFMELKIPLPDSVVNRGSLDGAREAILAIKHRAESPEGAAM